MPPPPDAFAATDRLLSRDFVLVTATAFLVLGSFFATFPLIPGFVEDELGGGPVAVGLAVGIFAVSAVAIRPLIARIGDEQGRRVLVVGGTMIIVAGLAGQVLVGNMVTLLITRLVLGAGEAAFFVGAATIVNDLAGPHRRGQATNYFSAAVYAGSVVGPFAGEAIQRAHGYDAAFATAAAVSAVAVFIALFLGPHRPPESDRSSRQLSLRERFLHPAALPPGLVLLAGTLTFAAFTGFMPLYGEDLGLSGVAPLFALYGVIVVVIRTVGARIPDQLGTMVSGTVAMLLIAAGMFTIGALDSVAGLYLGTAIWALGISVQYPALLVAALADVPDSERATATSTFTMFFEISGGIGGPLLGITAALAGVRATFVVSAVSALVGLGLLHTLVARRLG